MTIQSYTGSINTNNEYVSVASETGVTFTNGNSYTMQVQNSAYLKIGDAEFYVSNEKFQYKAGSETLYIKTSLSGCVLTILEGE